MTRRRNRQPSPPAKPQLARSTPAATPESLLSAGIAHHGAGRLAEAEAVYRQILALNPQHADALHLMGVIALQIGKPDVAVGLIAQAIRNNPRNPGYFSNLGSALRRLDRTQEALAACRQAVALDAGFADGLNNLANLLVDTNNYAEAAEVLRRLIVLRPHLTDQRLLLARSLILSERPEEAVTELQALLAITPHSAPAYINLGVALNKLGHRDQAMAAYHGALNFAPNDPGALNNLSILFQEQNRYDEAIDCCRRAIASQPDFADAHLNLALVLRLAMRLEDSIAASRAALELKPSLAEAHTNLGFCLLITGRLQEGFAEYEWRTRMKDFPSPKRSFVAPQWAGGDPAGKTLLIHDEQGVGDAIQFVRYARILQSRGARVFVECNTQLTRLLHNMSGIEGVIGRFSPLPPHDAQVSLLSLPLLLGTSLETIPTEVPYLRAEPEATAAWAARLGPRRGLRVGLVWAGNPEFKADNIRSPRLQALLPLLEVPGTEFFALQKGAGRQDLEHCGPLPSNFTDLGSEIQDFADTAAIMLNLDLVISSCTAPTHLAGALGRPVWTILPFAPDWRWLDRGSTSLWYPSMRLFRQERLGDWKPVVERVRAALEAALNSL